MKLKISIVLLLVLGLVISACSINQPGFEQSSKLVMRGNQLIFAKNYSIPPGCILEGDIVAVGATIALTPGAMVKGNILLIGSSLENKGIIQGNVNLIAGTATLRNGSILNGDVNQLFNNVVLEQKAQVIGAINSISFPAIPAERISSLITFISNRLNPSNWLKWGIIQVVATSFLALIAGIWLKKRVVLINRQIQSQPVLSWGTGILALAVLPIVSLILIITICLSPLGLFILIALSFAYLSGWIGLGIAGGALLHGWLRTQWPFELQAFLGSFVLGIATALIGWIPCIGWMFNILLGCMGLGAVIITRFGSQFNPAGKTPASGRVNQTF
jgi:hypothetical protein